MLTCDLRKYIPTSLENLDRHGQHVWPTTQTKTFTKQNIRHEVSSRAVIELNKRKVAVHAVPGPARFSFVDGILGETGWPQRNIEVEERDGNDEQLTPECKCQWFFLPFP